MHDGLFVSRAPVGSLAAPGPGPRLAPAPPSRAGRGRRDCRASGRFGTAWAASGQISKNPAFFPESRQNRQPLRNRREENWRRLQPRKRRREQNSRHSRSPSVIPMSPPRHSHVPPSPFPCPHLAIPMPPPRHSCESRNPAYKARASRSFMTDRGKGRRPKIRAVACRRHRANVRV
ncbi:MAG: hypothetical protein OXU61_01980, partial [Gammaproteobacteria bacterium]|nr:hypothetical protein [Gammaproteobacteria bacterium]